MSTTAPSFLESKVELDRTKPGTLILRLSGAWHLAKTPPVPTPRDLEFGGIQKMEFDTAKLEAWDTGTVTFLMSVVEIAKTRETAVDLAGLPEGIKRLIRLATTVPEKKTERKVPSSFWIARLGVHALEKIKDARDILDFTGKATLSFLRLFAGKAKFQKQDLFLFIQDGGAKALPIITLVNLLVGLILAFVGAVQLKQFGASIYIANLVGLGVAREMGAVMTAVVLSGRTGAAYAAQLGTMKVTQEIDAFKTLGIDPVDFLVLPRMLALCLVSPVLCLYADLMGIIGGAFVGTNMLHLSLPEYIHQTIHSVKLFDFAVGVSKSALFGLLIALSGCLCGMRCGNSASAVGDAATSSVVMSIVLIIVADGLITTLIYVLGT